MHHLPAWVRLLTDRRVLYATAWIITFGIAAGRIINARQCFNNVYRVDGNHGHTTIDFGGQWMMGRMLSSGHGQELYVRPVQRQVAQQAFPRHLEAPDTDDHDAEGLLDAYMGTDDTRWKPVGGALGATFLPSSPWVQAAVAISPSEDWSARRQHELFHPTHGDGIGGPLYPPIHAFVMLPFATGDHAQIAYYVMQFVQTGLCFFAGLGVHVLSRGRFWWPLATSILLIYPGCRGMVDLGQNSALTVAILIWGWAAMSRGWLTLGGIIWGLLAYKPVWALSFILLLVLMRQWRAVFAMGLTGIALIAMTLPFVGVHSWQHWLTIGQEAAEIYNVDGNWIPLSRDVLGLPRRLILDYAAPRSLRLGNMLALALCWALWAVILEIALRVFVLARKPKVPFTGPLPAMLIFTAWMCSYHFMYYDAMISSFGVFVLLADPSPYLRRRTLVSCERPDRRAVLFVNSFVLTWLVLLLGHETLIRPLRVEVTAHADEVTTERRLYDGSTEPGPRVQFGSGDRYPVDTLMVIVLWATCCVYSLQDRDEEPAPHPPNC